MMRAFATLLLATATLLASNPPQQFVSAEQTSAIKIIAGASASTELRFHVEDGYHINSSKPKSDLLIPTELKLENPPTNLRITGIQYPEGTELTLSFDPSQPLSVYSGDFAVRTKIAAARAAAPGNYQLHGELRYQACSDRACYPPRKLPVSLEVEVLPAR